MQLFIDSNHLSPYAMAVFVALREKRMAFETCLVDLKKSQHRSPSYAAVSATLRVPTIDDDGFHLSESSAICEYLDDVYPGIPLYPAAPQAKAKAREVQAWLRSDLMPIREERPTEVVFLGQVVPPLSAAAQAAADKLFAAARSLIPDGTPSLFADWCIADTDLALMLQRLVLAGDPVPERLASFARNQWRRPSVQEWVNMRRPVR